MEPGGLTNEAGVTDEVKAFCVLGKQDVETQVGRDRIQMYQPLTFRSQVVAGVNYFVKVQIGNDGSCLFLRLFQPLGAKVAELNTFQDNKWAKDPLKYF